MFTSGGTEGNELAIRGLIRGRPLSPTLSPLRGARGLHVVTSRLEHPSVAGALAAEGVEVTYVVPDADGRIGPDGLRAALRPDTVLVTLALANHELGNVYDIAALARVAHEVGALFHTDAVQAAGKVDVDVNGLGVDALTLSAHKIHGPKGVGAVYLRRGVPWAPLAAGGHQERERRAGTENVSGIVGFGVAARLAAAERAEAVARVAGLRDRLEARLLAIPGARRHGDGRDRLPGTLNVGFAGAPGQFVAAALDLEGISVSTGAACTSGSLAPSEVLLALGMSPAEAGCAIRFGIGVGNTEAEIDRAAEAVGGLCGGCGGRQSRSRQRQRWGSGNWSRESGGVDSSAAAALLVERGDEVIGATLRLYDASGTDASIGGRCCGPRDIEDARATAALLGIAHHVIDESAAFQHWVIDEFVAGYRAGQTPNPCVRCNEKLKFGPLLAFADAVGAAALATGHYARIGPGPDGGVVLGRAQIAARTNRISCSASVLTYVARLVPARRHRARTKCARSRDGPGYPTPTSRTRSRSASSPTATMSGSCKRTAARARAATSWTTRPAHESGARRHARLHDWPAPRRPGRGGRAALRPAHRRRDRSGARRAARSPRPRQPARRRRALAGPAPGGRRRPLRGPDPTPRAGRARLNRARPGRRRAGAPRRAGVRRRARSGRRVLRRRRAGHRRRLDSVAVRRCSARDSGDLETNCRPLAPLKWSMGSADRDDCRPRS